jgi:hypothetical protein
MYISAEQFDAWRCPYEDCHGYGTGIVHRPYQRSVIYDHGGELFQISMVILIRGGGEVMQWLEAIHGGRPVFHRGLW